MDRAPDMTTRTRMTIGTATLRLTTMSMGMGMNTDRPNLPAELPGRRQSSRRSLVRRQNRVAQPSRPTTTITPSTPTPIIPSARARCGRARTQAEPARDLPCPC